MSRTRRNDMRRNPSGPTPDELVTSAALSVIGQMQDGLSEAMRSSGVTADDLASKLGLTPAMVTFVLESPDAELRDVAAVGVALGVGFRVTVKR